MTIEELDQYISNHILKKDPLYHVIEGAPFRPGQMVRVLENPNNDATFDIEFASRFFCAAFCVDSGDGQ
jgi:hypothetical protein